MMSTSNAHVLESAAAAARAARAFCTATENAVRERLGGAALDPEALEKHQRHVHGLAWIATQVTSLEALLAWAERLKSSSVFGEAERLVVQIGFGEYLAQLLGGLPMSQTEFVRPTEMGVTEAARELQNTPAAETLIAAGTAAF